MTKKQLREHLLNAPTGTDPGEIIEALRASGVQMEGDPQAAKRSMLEPVPLEEGASVGGFAKNIAKSGGRLVKNVGEGLANVFNPNPEQNTAVNLGKLAIGAAANTVETVTGNEQLFNAPGEDLAHAAGAGFVNRFDDKGIGKTLYEDPVGAVADASTALGVGSTIAKVAKAPAAAKELASLAKASDPITQASKVIGATAQGAVNAATNPLNNRAERLYQSALKPTKAVESNFPDVVKTGLKNGIVLTKGSIDDVKANLEGLRQQVDDIIDTATTNGALISTEDVVSRMGRAKEFFKNTPGGSKFIDQLDNLADTFMKEQGKTIPLDKAQTIKKNTYTLIQDAYGDLDTAIREGQKDIARGLKEEIVNKVPEVKALNLKQSELIGLERALEDFVRRTGNRQVLDISTGAATAFGFAAEGAKKAAKALAGGKLIKAFFDDPAFKSWRALVYYRLGKGVELSGKTSEKVGTAAKAARVGELTNQAQ